MSVEGSLVRQESAKGPSENEQESNCETEGIPGWSLNFQTYELLQQGHCKYNAEEQSLVWPPMLLMCSYAQLHEFLDDDIQTLRNRLQSSEGMQANRVAVTKHVCCEGNRSYHLLVLPPCGLSFVVAKDFDCMDVIDNFHVFYPSLKEMFDIKNGRVPESSRQVFMGLNYHGRPRQAWIDLAVDLVRDDGVCVGRGVCQKYEVMDSVNDELLGEFHVGVRVLEVLNDLLPSHWKGSLRRWRTTCVLHNGVSLFECLRQHMQDESEDFFCEDGSGSTTIARAEGVLRDQSLSSVVPSVDLRKDFNVNFNYLPTKSSQTCRDAIDAIERSTFKSDGEAPSLKDGKSFETKYKSDESSKQAVIEEELEDASKKRDLMVILGTTNSSQLATDVVKRLAALQKLTGPRCSSTMISSMVREAEEREMSTLDSIVENAKREKRNKMVIAGFGNEIERFILRTRKEQHEKLLEEVENMKAKHVSTLEAFVQDKFKLVHDIGRRRKETEGIHEWLSHYTGKATDKEKKKWEEQGAEARLKEQKKWEEEVAKARLEEQKNCAEQVAPLLLKLQKTSTKVMTELGKSSLIRKRQFPSVQFVLRTWRG